MSHITPSSDLGGLIPQPDPPTLSGLPLSHADFRAHHAPLPPPHMVGSIDRPHMISAGNPHPPNAIRTLENNGRPLSTRRTRSQSAILAGTTPLCPDYRLAARSGFTASVASAPPPLRTSPPSSSARLGSTTSDRTASNNAPPTPMATTPDSPPRAAPVPTQPEQATDATVEATATGLSVSLLSFGHRKWEKAQRDDPLCDAVPRYLQLGCPQPLPSTFCDHIASHKRPDPADIIDLATKGRLANGDDDTLLLVRNYTAAGRPGRPPLDDSVRIYVPLLARPQIMHACHAVTSCHLGVTRALKVLQRYY